MTFESYNQYNTKLFITLALVLLLLTGCKKGNEFYTDYDEVAYNVFGEGYGVVDYKRTSKEVKVSLQEDKLDLGKLEDFETHIHHKILDYSEGIQDLKFSRVIFTVNTSYEDGFGNTYKINAYEITLTSDTIKELDFNTVNAEDIKNLAEEYVKNPELEELGLEEQE